MQNYTSEEMLWRRKSIRGGKEYSGEGPFWWSWPAWWFALTRIHPSRVRIWPETITGVRGSSAIFCPCWGSTAFQFCSDTESAGTSARITATNPACARSAAPTSPEALHPRLPGTRILLDSRWNRNDPGILVGGRPDLGRAGGARARACSSSRLGDAHPQPSVMQGGMCACRAAPRHSAPPTGE